jgi:histidine ammonia-lyase
VIEEPSLPREQLAREIQRVHDRLRSMSEDRLALPIPGHDSRAAAAHATARMLSLIAQGIEQRVDDAPSYRELPWVETAVAEQFAVCGHDVLIAVAALSDAEPVWVGMERSQVGDALREAIAALRSLRLAL